MRTQDVGLGQPRHWEHRNWQRQSFSSTAKRRLELRANGFVERRCCSCFQVVGKAGSFRSCRAAYREKVATGRREASQAARSIAAIVARRLHRGGQAQGQQAEQSLSGGGE